jgi:hypothetical protein
VISRLIPIESVLFFAETLCDFPEALLPILRRGAQISDKLCRISRAQLELYGPNGHELEDIGCKGRSHERTTSWNEGLE